MVNNEKEILRTTDIDKKSRLVKRLVNSGISYLEKWEKVPFFSRKKYDGAKEICVIMVNDHQMEKAMEILYEVNNGESLPAADRNKKEGHTLSDDDFFDEEDHP